MENVPPVNSSIESFPSLAFFPKSEICFSIFAKLKEANIDPVLFAYTDEDYELMQKNNVQLRSQIIKYIKIIEAYKAYYEPEEQEGKNNSIMKSSNFEPKSFDNDKD